MGASPDAPAASSQSGESPPVDLDAPQLTIRAIITGMLLGGLLAPCNIYAGLKIGWAFNMSIAAALISYGFWQTLHRTSGAPAWNLLENNINQTAASAGASIASAGLVAPIPALTIVTGTELAYPFLVGWVFVVSFVGVVVAVGLRRQMLEVDKLAFPYGVATAETIKEIYARGKEAMQRVKVLVSGAILAASVKLFQVFYYKIPKVGPAVGFSGEGLEDPKVETISLFNLGFVFNPSFLMLGFGAIIGTRAAASLFGGAIVAWGIIAPWAVNTGLAEHGPSHEFWFSTTGEWLLWPGVAMMICASLTSFAFSWRSITAAITDTLGTDDEEGQGQDAPATSSAEEPAPEETERQRHDVPASWFKLGLVVAGLLAVSAQILLFDIGFWVATFAVLLTFLLAVVAGRVSGETGITPIGAMGKVTQLTFGLVNPGNAASNLMAANVTGGAAGQCADMLHDLKTGLLVGASPKFQAIAQFFGVLVGSLAGSATYLLLIPNPQEQLLTDQWPAPAVRTWASVAEVFMEGFSAMPDGSLVAMAIAGAVAALLAVLEKTTPDHIAKWVPSGSSVGLAFVIPAWHSVSIFLGAMLALLAGVWAESWKERFMLVLAAGFVAGESLAGVAGAMAQFFGLG